MRLFPGLDEGDVTTLAGGILRNPTIVWTIERQTSFVTDTADLSVIFGSNKRTREFCEDWYEIQRSMRKIG
jgi:hypothetical protein